MGVIPDNVPDNVSRPQNIAGLGRKRLNTPKLGSSQLPSSDANASNDSLSEDNIQKDSKYQFNDSDLTLIKVLGSGTGGTVSLVRHNPTNMQMARKTIKSVATDENKDQIEKQIMRELRIMKIIKCPYIVGFYGAFSHNGNLNIMMEYMDLGTLESVYQRCGPIPEMWVATITYQIVKGLIYLFENHKIVHRDIKPANILLTSLGIAKLSDFGASKETAETLAMTFIGTQAFLSPERIVRNSPCTQKSDVWALGLTIMEVAMGKFPFPPEVMSTPFDLMQYITQEPSPTLPAGVFSDNFRQFCRACLKKDPQERPDPNILMRSPFIQNVISNRYDLKEWTRTLN